MAESRKPGASPVAPLADTAVKLPDGDVAEPAAALQASGSLDNDPLVGQVVGERFEITRLLDRGGMGRVYEAIQISLGRKVAIKVLHPDYDLVDADYLRFAAEAQLTAQLAHPHIVTVIELGQLPDGRYFYAMEYLDGMSLRDALTSAGGKFPIARALYIAKQVCDAMEVVHSRSVIHRDLKPENVFLVAGPEGSADFVKIVDFGLARLTDPTRTRLTQTGVGLGTVIYMSPEQVDGLELDGRTDIYALGAMLYEMLTGALPHDADSLTAVLRRKATEEPVSLRTHNPEIPELLDQLVLQMLSRDLHLRPAQMRDVRASLTDCELVLVDVLTDLTGNASPVPSEQSQSQVARFQGGRRIWVVWLILVILGGTIMALMTWSPKNALQPAPRIIVVPEQRPPMELPPEQPTLMDASVATIPEVKDAGTTQPVKKSGSARGKKRVESVPPVYQPVPPPSPRPGQPVIIRAAPGK